jgi:hypothetical protein
MYASSTVSLGRTVTESCCMLKLTFGEETVEFQHLCGFGTSKVERFLLNMLSIFRYQWLFIRNTYHSARNHMTFVPYPIFSQYLAMCDFLFPKFKLGLKGRRLADVIVMKQK